MEYQWVVSREQSGTKLVAFLAASLPQVHTNRQIKRALEGGCCSVNGRIERFASYAVGLGDRVVFVEQDPLQKVAATILYEDDELLVIDKPVGMRSDAKGVLSRYPYYLVHRLDKETSGGLILAKSDHAFAHLKEQFKMRQVKKHYIALVDGVIAANRGVIECSLEKKGEYQGQAFWGVAAKGGKQASTRWKVITRGSQATSLQCQPLTGRTHQLRVHLAYIGHPILGDTHYSRSFASPLRVGRVMLHAAEVAFFHPSDGRQIVVSVPPPDDFNEILKEI